MEINIDEISRNFIRKINEINNDEIDINCKLGMIGELFVGECIRQTLWQKGYALNPDLSARRCYALVWQYGTNENNNGGMDYYLRVRRENEVHEFLIEVKNWRRYQHITETMFNEKILDRFVAHDVQHAAHWVVAMNVRNRPLIWMLCAINRILILPIREHITPSEYMTEERLQETMLHFIVDFSRMIDEVVGGGIDENNGSSNDSGSVRRQIEDDIRLGVKYKIIVKQYNTTRNYVMKLASIMRRNGQDVHDRRRRAWRNSCGERRQKTTN